MKVEIACIIDRSASMGKIRGSAVAGFNEFLNGQKAIPGEAKVSLALFDHEYLLPFDAVDIKSVPELTMETYVPRGNTAMYDAIGRMVTDIGMRLDLTQEKPDKVLVVILTDGEENASSRYSKEQIAEMIKHQEEKYSWEFIFLAANQDAFAAGRALNIKMANTQNFLATAEGTRGAYANASKSVSAYRTR
jgi:Mg-chelatase subunit ChlD